MNEDDLDWDRLDDVGLTHSLTGVWELRRAAALQVQLPAVVKQNQALKSSCKLKYCS